MWSELEETMAETRKKKHKCIKKECFFKSGLKAVLISSERVFCGQEGDFSSVRSFACHSLASVRRRQTVWFGTHAICSSLMSTRFQAIEAQFFSKKTVCFELLASEVAKSSFHQTTSNTLCSYLLVYSGCLSLSFCWLEFQLWHLRKPSAVGAWQQRVGRRLSSYVGHTWLCLLDGVLLPWKCQRTCHS